MDIETIGLLHQLRQNIETLPGESKTTASRFDSTDDDRDPFVANDFCDCFCLILQRTGFVRGNDNASSEILGQLMLGPDLVWSRVRGADRTRLASSELLRHGE